MLGRERSKEKEREVGSKSKNLKSSRAAKDHKASIDAREAGTSAGVSVCWLELTCAGWSWRFFG